jgi:aldose 1-epimerase
VGPISCGLRGPVKFMTVLISLSQGDFALDIAPQAGGGISRLDWQGLPLLRRALDGAVSARDPLGLSCFPMTPYVSRITDGVFSWGDVTTAIAPNMVGGEHPLHGIGWRKAWEVSNLEENSVTLKLSHKGDSDWPWAFETWQEFRIQDSKFVHSLAVCSQDMRAFPASLGPHPYFNADLASIQFQADALWEISGESLPSHKARPILLDQLAVGIAARSLDLDHCFEGWDGCATLRWPDFGLHIGANVSLNGVPQDCTRLQLYTPVGAHFFCLEPVTARCVSFSEPDPSVHGVVELSDQTLMITTSIEPFIIPKI